MSYKNTVVAYFTIGQTTLDSLRRTGGNLAKYQSRQL